jgi:hypothetical protein
MYRGSRLDTLRKHMEKHAMIKQSKPDGVLDIHKVAQINQDNKTHDESPRKDEQYACSDWGR